MRLNPWLAPLTLSRAGLAGKVLRRKLTRRKTANLLSQMTERLEVRTLLTGFFTVDTYLDTVDTNPGDGFAMDTNGKTSLRAAVMEANALAGFDQILLQGGTYSLSLEGDEEDAAMTGDLDITDTDGLQIFGTSSFSILTTIIDAQSIDRVFEVFPGVSLELVEIGITGGDVRGRGNGGAIRVDGGQVVANIVSITENHANNGGAISNSGGIVTISSSVLSNNRAEGDPEFGQGGAIESTGGAVTVQDSTIHDNLAMSVGGGIAISGGTLNVTNSTIAQNSVGEAQMSSGDGGGIYIQSGVTATLLASTVAFNNAGNEGGGIWTNGSLTLERTLISNNVTNSGVFSEGAALGGGMITSNGHNLVREDTNFNFTPATGDLVGSVLSPIDPNIIGLGDNGGLTPTIALGGESPAIDAGPINSSPLFQDQRGFNRERDGNRDGMVFTDIGAFEVQSPADFFVDDAGDYLITNDQGAQGLDFGDTVTFDPNGSVIAGLIFGERAFTTINGARTAAFFNRDAAVGSEIGEVGDLLNEIVLGPGTYFESVLLNVPDLLVRGHSGVATDTIIDAGGAPFGLQVTESGVQLNSLRVTNAVTGVDLDATSLGGQSRPPAVFQASNIQVDGNSEDGIRFVETSGTNVGLQIRNSILSSNAGVGLKITGADTVELQDVTASGNNVDGIAISNVFETVLDSVTVNENGDLGFNFQTVGPLWVRNPGTSLNTNGNEFTNVSVLALEPVSGNISNSVTVTDVDIQFNAGAGTQQETLTLSDVDTVQITGSGGSDIFVIDYSAAGPPSTRQLFLNGGQGNDAILSVHDANQQLTNARLTIGGIDDVVIANFEQASLTGGVGNNNLNATEFDGPVILNGLEGNDTLRGSSGNDVLDGGADDDILDGGPLQKQYVLGDTDFEVLNLNDTDTGVVALLQLTQTAKIPLDDEFFRFNDVTYTGDNLFVAPSGVASLGGPIFPQNNFDLTDAPNIVGGIPILAPLFDDWVTGGNAPQGLALPEAKVLYKFEDTNSDLIDDRLIIEWNEVYHQDQINTFSTPFLKSGASPVTFQLILELNTSDRDGDITFNYVDLDTGTPFSSIANGISATVGGRDGGEHPGGVQQISFNSPNSLVASNRAIVARSADSDGNDILTGDSGNDVLFSSSGNDSIDGGDGANDRFIFGSFNNDLASDHMIDSSAVESTVFQTPNRSVNFKATYTNIEALAVGLGPANQNVVIDVDGLPDSVSLDTREPSALDSDTVVIIGTAPSAPTGVVRFDGNYSGTYTGIFFVGEGQTESIPGPTFPENSVAAAISNGSISISQPDPGDGTVDSGGNITFISPGMLMGEGYTVEFTGTLVESGGAVSGSGTWTVLSNSNGISGNGSWSIVRDSGAPLASGGADNFALSGSTISVGATTLNLAGVETLELDISNGGADTVSVNQDFSGSARKVLITGDLSDDTVSIQSTAKQQNVVTFLAGEEYVTLIREMLGGEIVLEEVLNDDGDDGSGNTIENQLAPDQVIVSPDGSRVYVAASDSDALVVYSRDRVTGDLTFIESLANMGIDAFGNTITGLDGASKVIVSADGRNVYVASELDQTIAFFVRQEGDNQLSFISSTILDADGNPVNVDLPSDMALIPNGSVLMVSSETGNRIDFFDVGSTGDLVFQGSLLDGGQDSGMTTIDGLAGASSVAVSPDGRHIYVTGANDNAIAVFSEPSAQSEMSGFALPLFFMKLANGDLDTSLNVVSGLTGASSVEVSPDGLHVYVTGETDNSITVFSRTPETGDLTFVESLTDSGQDSMGNTVENLLAPASVSISPDGTTVYVAASGSDAVTLFNRDASSDSLTFLETLSSGDTDGAGTTVVGLNGVSSIFASVDGQHVYASGTGDDAVVRFNVPRFPNVSTDGNAPLSITTSDADDLFSLNFNVGSLNLAIDAGGTSDNDEVAIFGTGLEDTLSVNGGTLISGSSTFSLTNVERLDLSLNDGDDTVNITASSSGPLLFVDGGADTTGDVLNIDPQTSMATDTGTQVTFSGGFQSISYVDIETVEIQTAPTPVISSSDSDPTNSATIPVSVDFGESVTGFVQGDVSVSGGTISNFVDGTGGVFTFDVTPSGDGTITVDIAAAAATDLAANASLVATQFSIVSDQTVLTPVISSSESNPTNSATIPVSVAFGESMTGFVQGDVSVSGGPISKFADGGGGVFTFDVTPSGDGTITFDVAALVAEDLAGNDNLIATQFSIVSDRTAPTPVISSSDSDPTNSATIPVSVAFGESMTGFDQGDLSVSGGTISNFVDASGGVFTFDVTPSGDGAITVDIAATVAEDLAGNDNLIATQFSIVSDRTSPTPVISSSDSDPSNSAMIPVSVAFGETMTGFVQGDLSVSGGTISNFADGGGGVFTFDVTPSADGTIAVDIVAATVADLAGNDNLAATQFSIVSDRTAPTPVISSSDSDPTSSAAIPVSVSFGESVTGFDQGDLSVSGGTISNFVDGTGGVFTFDVTPSSDGTISVDIAALVAEDQAGNDNLVATQFSIVSDRTAPTPVISSSDPDPTNSAMIPVSVAFGESMTGFVQGDVSVSGGTISNFDDVGGGVFTFDVTPSGDGTISVDIAALVAEDLAGNDNLVATQFSIVSEMNDPPVLDLIGDKTAFVDQELAFTVTATDPDDPPSDLIFSLGKVVPGFIITPSGDVTFTPTSFDRGQTFSMTVIVTENDGDALSASETFLISVLDVDFGDAPDSYGTTLTTDGPRHGVTSLFLGAAVDAEDDGQPDAAASGDDLNSTRGGDPIDDEDGITFLSALTIGTTRLFRVSASEPGFLDAWIDFDGSGDFSTSENLSSAALLIPDGGSPSSGFTIGSGIAVPAGFSTVSFDIPNAVMIGETFARFRLSSTGGLAPTGLAGDGEVEDHLVEIVAAPVGNSDSLEAALDTAVDAFFDAFPDELNDPDPTSIGDELPLAVQAEGGAEAERTDGNVELDVTDPLLRVVIQAINDVVNRLEEDRAADENIFVLALHPVDFLLTDPQGRTVGFTQAAGTVNEIGADATFTGDGVVELLTIRNADPGGYGLQLVGVGGVFRGGASLITPAGTQQITFQGSLAQNDDVQLALTYQEGLASFPTRTDIESVDFSEIADYVAQIPTVNYDANTLAAGATEALASIAMDRLDASLFSRQDEEEAALERLLARISETRKKLLDALKTSLDDDELESLKRIFGDEGEDSDSVEILARVLLETLSGPLISAPRQVKELSGSLQQLLDQLRAQQEQQQKQNDNQQPAPSNDSKGAVKPEAEDKRTSQYSPSRTSATVVNSAFVNTSDAAKRRRIDQASGTKRDSATVRSDKQQIPERAVAAADKQNSQDAAQDE
jgi:6-phosphogluconolactonase (cycloisomerase 2 family)